MSTPARVFKSVLIRAAAWPSGTLFFNGADLARWAVEGAVVGRCFVVPLEVSLGVGLAGEFEFGLGFGVEIEVGGADAERVDVHGAMPLVALQVAAIEPEAKRLSVVNERAGVAAPFAVGPGVVRRLGGVAVWRLRSRLATYFSRSNSRIG